MPRQDEVSGVLAVNGGPPVRTKPFHPWPVFDEEDARRLVEVLESRRWAFDGPAERELERAFAHRHDALDAVAVSNGSVSLLIALRAMGIRPGDEVVVPSLTWIATATCAMECNAVPVVVDVDPRTLCMDPSALRAAITPRTVAVVPVHLYTCMADMDAILDVAARHHLSVIEDCAHAHGARWRDRGAGSLGTIGSFSFQLSKVMTAGEGGMLVSRDRKLLDRCYSEKNCGRHPPERGSRGFGTNHRMTEWQAAVLLGQLRRLDEHHARRERGLRRLRELLAPFPAVQVVADQASVTQRPFYRVVLHYDKELAGGIPLQQLVAAVRAEGIPVEHTYPALPDNELFVSTGVSWYERSPRVTPCPAAERAARQTAFTVCHEVFLGPDEDVEDVVRAVEKVLAHPDEAASLADRLKDKARNIVRGFL